MQTRKNARRGKSKGAKESCRKNATERNSRMVCGYGLWVMGIAYNQLNYSESVFTQLFTLLFTQLLNDGFFTELFTELSEY